MLTLEVPSDVHQLHCIKRAAPAPRRARRVCALSLESVLDRHEAGRGTLPPPDAEIGADVSKQHDIHILEVTLAHKVRLGSEQLFRRARPEFDCTRKLAALHQSFDGQRGSDVERLPGIVTFAVPRRAFDQRVVIRDARSLRSLRNAINVGAKSNDRLARSPRRHPGGRNARDATLNFEALFFKNAGQILRGLVFLKSQLGEAENHIHHYLGLLLHCFDIFEELSLVLLRRIGLRLRGPRKDQAEHSNYSVPEKSSHSIFLFIKNTSMDTPSTPWRA